MSAMQESEYVCPEYKCVVRELPCPHCGESESHKQV